MKPRLLFLSPVTPAPSGNGRAMRANRMLTALASRFEVSLLILESRLTTAPDFTTLRERTGEIVFLPPETGSTPVQRFRRAVLRRIPSLYSLLFGQLPEWAPITPLRLALAADAFPGKSFDALHVFRLHLAPYAQTWLDRRGRPAQVNLDLDDIESVTRRRIAELYRMNHQPLRALAKRREAEQLRDLERRWLHRFDRVWVCSETDAALLRKTIPGIRTAVAPNVVSIPPSRPPAPVATSPFRFLFVGTLGYYPNQDGILWLAREVLPRLRQQADRPFLVVVAGAGLPGWAARQLRQEPEIEFCGFVPDLSGLYAQAHAVLVPLRAGGGSRIKILEAFAQGVPVLSTSMGAEGLDVRAGVDLLLADDAGDFAGHALELMRDTPLRATLSGNAFQRVASTYSPAALARLIHGP